MHKVNSRIETWSSTKYICSLLVMFMTCEKTLYLKLRLRLHEIKLCMSTLDLQLLMTRFEGGFCRCPLEFSCQCKTLRPIEFFKEVVGISCGTQMVGYGWLDLAGLLIDHLYSRRFDFIAEITNLDTQHQECWYWRLLWDGSAACQLSTSIHCFLSIHTCSTCTSGCSFCYWQQLWKRTEHTFTKQGLWLTEVWQLGAPTISASWSLSGRDFSSGWEGMWGSPLMVWLKSAKRASAQDRLSCHINTVCHRA